jgi:hypothetical protein
MTRVPELGERNDPDETLREARARYFDDNGFGPDGGYDESVEIIELGPIPIPIPNTQARVAAIRFHDLHHVLTGYRTDLTGEAEIGAWEIASGCADKWFAWAINLQAMLLGLVVAPVATYRGFVRGRHTRSLYREPFEESLLERGVRDERRRLGLDASVPPATAADRLAFLGWTTLSGAINLGPVALVVWAGVRWLG